MAAISAPENDSTTLTNQVEASASLREHILRGHIIAQASGGDRDETVVERVQKGPFWFELQKYKGRQ